MTRQDSRRTRTEQPKKNRAFGMSSLELSVQPSFGPGVVLSRGLPEADEEAILACCVTGLHNPLVAECCHRVVDASTWEQRIPPTTVTSLRKALLRDARMMPRFAMGLDGTRYTVKIHAGYNAVEYRWWARTPPGWEPLASLVRELATIARVSEVLQRDWPSADYSSANC